MNLKGRAWLAVVGIAFGFPLSSLGSQWQKYTLPQILQPFFPPEITFKRPLWFSECPVQSGHYFVMEQGGVIYKLTPKGATFAKNIFLAIEVNDGPNEMGLLGMAFHPQYAQNHKYFLNYNPPGKKRTLVVERKADARFEKDSGQKGRILLEFAQPYGNHNGGGIEFGPDGFLYIGVGDGGASGDPLGSGQDLQQWLGSLLRIDVGKSGPNQNYQIPKSNPYFGRGPEIKEEIFVSGLRNPWRFSFDPLTGELWIGDVGQNAFEEISLARGGDNLGWNTMEGFSCFKAKSCDSTALRSPLLSLPAAEARSITGGYVYRGRKDSPFYGVYLFGDYVTQNVWGATHKNGKLENLFKLGKAPGRISSFGVDQTGNIFMTCFDGKVYRLIL